MEDKKITGKAHEQGSHYYNGKGSIDTVGFFNQLEITKLDGSPVNPMIPAGMFNIFKYVDRAGLKEGEPYIKDIVKAKNYCEMMIKRLNLDLNWLVIKSKHYSLKEMSYRKKWNGDKAIIMQHLMDGNFHSLLEYLELYISKLQEK